MKDKIILIAMSVIVIIGIGVGRYYWGKQTSSADKQENISAMESSDEKESVSSPKRTISKVQKQRDEAIKEEVTPIWEGASSRTDLQGKLTGTTWETTRPDGYMNLYHKFVISGDEVKEYTARRTRNYDDPKNWNESTEWDIHSINEPEKGLYVVALKGKAGTGIFEETPVFLVFKGTMCFYSLAGNEASNTPITLVSSK